MSDTRSRAMPAVARRRLETLADLIHSLGDIPTDRVRIVPPPGRATESDLLRLAASEDRLFELVDGTLVEKTFGWAGASLGVRLGVYLLKHSERDDLGTVAGPQAALRLRPGLVRSPSLTFVFWENYPAEDDAEIPDLAPDLAVEMIRSANTPNEMARKRREYFQAGTRLVWQVYPARREVEVYTSPSRARTLRMGDTLDGGDLLPGFRLPLTDLFAVRGGKKKGTARRRKKS